MSFDYSVGAYPEARNESLIVTNSSQVIAQSRNPGLKDGMRKGIVIRNIADDVTKIITLNFGSETATANNGIVLKQGESITDSSDNPELVWQGQITAICAVASATATIAIHER